MNFSVIGALTFQPTFAADKTIWRGTEPIVKRMHNKTHRSDNIPCINFVSTDRILFILCSPVCCCVAFKRRL